jgi:uncharacterized membrane protein (UPF0127 family)
MFKQFAKYSVGHKMLKCNDISIKVLVADSETTRTKGLSGVYQIAQNEGMLFDFKDGEQERCFHMKGCRFDIEAIAVSSGGVIVGIQQMKHTEPNVLHRIPHCAKVLEVQSGFCQKMGIAIGDIIQVG